MALKLNHKGFDVDHKVLASLPLWCCFFSALPTQMDKHSRSTSCGRPISELLFPRNFWDVREDGSKGGRPRRGGSRSNAAL